MHIAVLKEHLYCIWLIMNLNFKSGNVLFFPPPKKTFADRLQVQSGTITLKNFLPSHKECLYLLSYYQL